MEVLESAVSCAICNSRAEQHRFLIRAHINMTTWPGARQCRIVICTNCGLVFISPRLDAAGYLRFYAESFNVLYRADSPAAASARQEHRQIGAEIAAFCERQETLRDKSIKTVLDIGCGFGDILSLLKERWQARAVGVEISDVAVEFAKSTYALEILRQNIESLELPSKTFDVVILSAVLEHTMDPVAMLRQARAALKEDGVLFVRVPDLSRIDLRISRADLLQRVFKPLHTYYFTAATLAAIQRSVGLEPTIVEQRSRDPHQGELWSLAKPAGHVEPPDAADAWRAVSWAVWKQCLGVWLFSESAQMCRAVVGDRAMRRIATLVGRGWAVGRT